jgi:hypothetical protein
MTVGKAVGSVVGTTAMVGGCPAVGTQPETIIQPNINMDTKRNFWFISSSFGNRGFPSAKGPITVLQPCPAKGPGQDIIRPPSFREVISHVVKNFLSLEHSVRLHRLIVKQRTKNAFVSGKMALETLSNAG